MNASSESAAGSSVRFSPSPTTAPGCTPVAPPSVLSAPSLRWIQLEAVRHRDAQIRLVVNGTRCHCDRDARHELADERHRVPLLAIDASLHVESKIHFLERPVKRNRDAADARVGEHEADDAHVRFAAKEMQLRALWHQRFEKALRHDVVEQYEVQPLGRQKHWWFFVGGVSGSMPSTITRSVCFRQICRTETNGDRDV